MGDEWSLEYYNLLSDITTRRNNYEHVSINTIKDYINKEARPLFDKHKYRDGVVKHLDGAFPEGGASFTDIHTWCCEHAAAPDDEDNKLQAITNLYKYYADHKDEYKHDSIYDTTSIPWLAACTTLEGNVYYVDTSINVMHYFTDANKDVYNYVGRDIRDTYDIYKLTRVEWWRLSQFWDKVLAKYKTTYDLASLLDHLDEYADSLTLYAEWPQKSEIAIDGVNYDYFFFDNYDYWKYDAHRMADDPEDGTAADADGVTAPEQPSAVKAPSEGDAQASFDDKGLDDQDIDQVYKPETQITDTKYWVKYFGLATILSLLPMYWAPGLILPTGTIIKLPAVFIALKAIHIKALDLLLVVGLSIRGIAILPVFLYVNLSSNDLSLLFPLTIALKQVKAL